MDSMTLGTVIAKFIDSNHTANDQTDLNYCSSVCGTVPFCLSQLTFPRSVGLEICETSRRLIARVLIAPKPLIYHTSSRFQLVCLMSDRMKYIKYPFIMKNLSIS